MPVAATKIKTKKTQNKIITVFSLPPDRRHLHHRLLAEPAVQRAQVPLPRYLRRHVRRRVQDLPQVLRHLRPVHRRLLPGVPRVVGGAGEFLKLDMGRQIAQILKGLSIEIFRASFAIFFFFLMASFPSNKKPCFETVFRAAKSLRPELIFLKF